MLDKIQFLLSLQILGFCVFGGITLLLRARENRAKQILGWSMLLWAFLAAVRVSVNLYLEDSKEIFHPDVLIMGCIVVATLACYVIEVLRPCYMTVRRFFIFTSPIWVLGISFLIYRIAGGNIHRYKLFWRGIRYLESGCGYKAFDFIFHASVYDRSYLSDLAL